jgi:hypothetical protein
MSSIDSPTLTPRPRSRRRLAAWLAFGVTGLAIGAVWATGFTSFSATQGTTAGSPAMAKGTPADDANALTATASKINDLSFDFTGRWGSIAANTVAVKVDLSAFAAGKHYNVALLLANTSDLTDWASMQLKFENVYKAAATASCDPADFTGSAHAKVLNFDNEDAGVYWNALPGNAVYCLGVSAATGDDVAGTFLRSATDTPPTHFPSFITTVDRAD